MLSPSVLPGFLAAVFIIAVAPGPDNAYIAAVALHRGPRAGIMSAFGMALGMTFHVAAAALGLGALLRAAPWSLTAIQVLGGLYLAWLAFDAARALQTDDQHGVDLPLTWRTLVQRAALTNLTNPKVILFFAAFLPQFVRPGYGPPALQLLFLGLLFLLVGLAVDAAWGLAVGRGGQMLTANSAAGRVLGAAAALTYGALAVILLTTAATEIVS